jgi:hypothetical protein|tara:strand:- start:264 stop:446 length:183 start_codon:yes stop_codon:yes gene_type:complete
MKTEKIDIDLLAKLAEEERNMTYEKLLKRQQEQWAAENAKWHKYNTEFNRQQMEDSCEGG